MIRLWDLAETGRKKNPLPIILPLILYHGKRRWRLGTELAALHPLSGELAAYIPRFTCLLTNLRGLSDDEIMGPSRLRAVLLALRGRARITSGIRGRRHPAPLRYSSVETSKVAPSSRLAGQAPPRSPSCEVILARPLRVITSPRRQLPRQSCQEPFQGRRPGDRDG